MDGAGEPEHERLRERLIDRGVDVERVEGRRRAQRLETPSSGYATSGIRFAVFGREGAPAGWGG